MLTAEPANLCNQPKVSVITAQQANVIFFSNSVVVLFSFACNLSRGV